MSDVRSRWESLSSRVETACLAAGRQPGSVELLAVSKLQPVEALRAAFDAGVRAFGENYAQELRDKAAALADCQGIRWHAIGTLQRHLESHRASHRETDNIHPIQPKVIEQRPKVTGKTCDGIFLARRLAAAASRQIRHDDAKTLFQHRQLQTPIGAARS